METLLEKKLKLDSVSGDKNFDWYQAVWKYVTEHRSDFEDKSLAEFNITTPKEWDKLITDCIQGKIAGDPTVNADDQQYFITLEKVLDGQEAKTGHIKLENESADTGEKKLYFPPDAVKSGYLKIKKQGEEINVNRLFGLRSDVLSKDLFEIVPDKSNATIFSSEQTEAMLKFLKNCRKVPGTDPNNEAAVKKNYYIVAFNERRADKQALIQKDVNSLSEFIPATSHVGTELITSTSNDAVGRIIPNNILDLYVATLNKLVLTDDLKGSEVTQKAIEYFGGNKAVRDLIYKKVGAKKGFTSNPIMNSYAVLKKYYGPFYKNLSPERLLSTVNTLSNVELSGHEVLQTLGSKSEQATLWGIGGFNAEPTKIKISDSIQKLELYNSFNYGNYVFEEHINRQEKALKDKLKLNIFATNATGKEKLDELLKMYSTIDPDGSISKSVTDNKVFAILEELPALNYDNLMNSPSDVRANPLADVKNYIQKFTVKSNSVKATNTKYKLIYTEANSTDDSASTVPFKLVPTDKTEYEVYNVNTNLTFKKGTKFIIIGSTNTNLATNVAKTYYTKNSSVQGASSYAPFELKDGTTLLFNGDYACDELIIHIDDEGKIVDAPDGIIFKSLKPLSSKNNEKESEKEKEKEKPKATIENDTKPKSGPRKTKIGDKDVTQITLWAEEFTNKLTDPNIDKKALIDEYINKLDSTYTKGALAIIPTLFKGAGVLTKYRRFATMAQNLGTKSKNNIQI